MSEEERKNWAGNEKIKQAIESGRDSAEIAKWIVEGGIASAKFGSGVAAAEVLVYLESLGLGLSNKKVVISETNSVYYSYVSVSESDYKTIVFPDLEKSRSQQKY